jgi:hypothetical protein
MNLVLLIISDLRRLLRERMVVRSLSFPILLTAGTLVLTLFAAWISEPNPTVALSPQLDSPELRMELKAAGFQTMRVDDPNQAVEQGKVWAGMTQNNILISGPSPLLLPLEAIFRETKEAPWRPDPLENPPKPDTGDFGTTIMKLLSAIYALYGVVIGAASLTRDRADGTLEVGYTLPISRWLFPASRWLAASAVITLFLITGSAVIMAMVGYEHLASVLRNGCAAILTATALGVMATSAAGRGQNLSSGLGKGLSLATMLFGVGYALPSIAIYLPLASLNSQSNGIAPLFVAIFIGVSSCLLFAYRSAR